MGVYDKSPLPLLDSLLQERLANPGLKVVLEPPERLVTSACLLGEGTWLCFDQNFSISPD